MFTPLTVPFGCCACPMGLSSTERTPATLLAFCLTHTTIHGPNPVLAFQGLRLTPGPLQHRANTCHPPRLLFDTYNNTWTQPCACLSGAAPDPWASPSTEPAPAALPWPIHRPLSATSNLPKRPSSASQNQASDASMHPLRGVDPPSSEARVAIIRQQQQQAPWPKAANSIKRAKEWTLQRPKGDEGREVCSRWCIRAVTGMGP
eukprot:1160097-Pelagomonas_calceolata.AAC.4